MVITLLILLLMLGRGWDQDRRLKIKCRSRLKLKCDLLGEGGFQSWDSRLNMGGRSCNRSLNHRWDYRLILGSSRILNLLRTCRS